MKNLYFIAHSYLPICSLLLCFLVNKGDGKYQTPGGPTGISENCFRVEDELVRSSSISTTTQINKVIKANQKRRTAGKNSKNKIKILIFVIDQMLTKTTLGSKASYVLTPFSEEETGAESRQSPNILISRTNSKANSDAYEPKAPNPVKHVGLCE